MYHPRSVAGFILLLLCLRAGAAASRAAGGGYNVRDYGAAADDRTMDTVAIQKAIDSAAAAGGGEVSLPPGTYRAGSIELKSHVTLRLDAGAIIHGSASAADYPLVTARWEGIKRQCHQALIFADHAEDIAITGSGTILGEGKVGKLRDPRGPTLIEPSNCRNVRLSGVTIGNIGVWTLHPTYCRGVTVSNATIDSTGKNSDGIDPDSCQGVVISHCTFSAGDDDIAIKSGKGEEGVKIGMPADDITITDCTFTKGHAGIALGSELSGGISRVKIANCKFSGVKEAIYMKSSPGRAGYVRDVQAGNLTVTDTALLVIQTTYHSNPDSQGVPGDAGLTSFGGIAISDVRADSKRLVTVEATPERPVDGLALSNITGSCREGFVICNAKGVALANIKLDGMKDAALYTQNAEGTGLEGAVPYVPKTKKE
jgi:polygalacturonase